MNPSDQPSIRITESQAREPQEKADANAENTADQAFQKSASLHPEALELAAISDRSVVQRLEPWAKLTALRRLMPKHRVCMCCRIPIPKVVRGVTGVQVLYRAAPAGRPESQASARFGNVALCGNPWVCPICAPRLARLRSKEIHRALVRHAAGGGRVMLVTLTHHHDRNGQLSDQNDLQATALAKMQRTGSFRKLCANHGVIGTIRALEVTHSRRAGWHVHLHLILFLAGSTTQSAQYALQMRQMDAGALNRRQGKTLPDRSEVKVPSVRSLPAFGRAYTAAWSKAAKAVGLHAKSSDQRATIASCDVASLERLANYLTKAGRGEGAPGSDNVAAFGNPEDHAAAVRAVESAGRHSTMEVAKKVADGPIRHKHGRGKTPHEYLCAYTFANDLYAGALYAEYAAAVKGRATVSFSRGLRALYRVKERTPEEDKQNIAQNLPKELLLAIITLIEWQAVLRGPPLTRGHLIESARKQDLLGLRRQLDELLALFPK